MRILLSTLFLSLCCTVLSAQAALVKDIRTGSASSSPSEFVEFNGKLIFKATGDSLGTELYISDGTEAGTMVLKNINDSTSVAGGSSNPGDFYRFNNQLYFQANNGSQGSELWVTDGTPEGTHLVHDVTDGALSSSPTDFIEFDGNLYFTASDTFGGFRPPITNTEFYRLNDSGDSTFRIKDLVEGVGSGYPDEKLILGSSMVFKGTIGEVMTPRGTVAVSGLWTSDGTTDGTQKAPDATDEVNQLQNLTVYQDKVYFSGSIPAIGREVFSYAGDSIRLVGDFRKEPGISTNPGSFFVYDDYLFFAGNTDTLGNELYMSDGTEAGTRIIDINLGPACCGNPGTNNSRPKGFFEVNGLDEDKGLIFEATDSVAKQYMALFIDEGEPEFVSFRDLFEIPFNSGYDMISTGSTLYFGADTDEHGTEVWKLSLIGDAVPERVSDLNPGEANSSPNDLILVGDKVLFYAQDSMGRELYGLDAERADYQVMEGADRLLNDLDTIDLGTLFVGETVDGIARISSTGTGPNAAVVINDAEIAAPFSIVADSQIDSIPTGMFSDVTISFAPTSEGDYLDSLHISVYGPNGPETVIIYLTATAALRVGALEATANDVMLTGTETVDYGNVLAFQDSTIAIILSNTGTGPLQYTPSLRIGEKFTADDLDATQIAVGGMDTINITFAPQSVSTYEDTLVLALQLNTETTGELLVPLMGNSIVNSINNFGIEAVRAFPNPTTDQLYVELSEPLSGGTMRVFDVNGRQVLEGNWPQNSRTHSLALGALPAGSYTLEVVDRQGRLIIEVIKR